MTRPKITVQDALKIAKDNGVTDQVFIIGIRGYYKNSMGKPGQNDRGIYDDAIILVGPEYYETFNGNTDPSKFRPGIAKLLPGVHRFKKGNHGISRPGGGYPAFRPATPDESLPVSRDGKTGVFKGFAINIHKGSINSTSSEGCQTIYPDQWIEFKDNAYLQMDLAGQKTIPYILIEQQ